MYAHQQECARKAAERCEVQDLERRLAEIYAGIEGGEDAADLTAPRVRQLITSGAVKRPQALLCAPSGAASLLAAPAGVDVAALAQSAFAATPAPAVGALALHGAAGGALATPRRALPSYNRALGVDPAARPRQLGATQLAEAAGVAVTATAFRDLTLPD